MLFRFDPKRLPLPRGGKPGNVDCPLIRGEVPFEDCIRCKYHDIDSPDSWSYSFCLIKKEDEEKKLRKEQEEINRRATEWRAKVEAEDRAMREEMAEWRKQMERNFKKWQKEYQKEQEEYAKMMKEFRDIERQSMIQLYGEREVEFWERVFEDKKSDEYDENEEEEEREEIEEEEDFEEA